jgi:DNA-directed RNA polymerase subunit beta-beta'
MSKANSLRVRKSFSKIKSVISMPNLLDLQRNSYEAQFLQLDTDYSTRENKGMQSVFCNIFPITDATKTITLEFVGYELDQPKFDILECKQRGASYASPLKVMFRLIIWDVDHETGAKEIKSIKEQQVYMGDLPLMTKNGTFVVNGTERVVVSQICRSPGVFFDHDKGKSHASGKLLHSARIIPYRGSWLDIEFDAKDLIYFRIDKRRKIYISTLLRALGMSSQDIFDFYYSNLTYSKVDQGWITDFWPELVVIQRLKNDLINAENNQVMVQSGQKITPRLAKKLAKDGLKKIIVQNDDLIGQILANNILHPITGEVIEKIGSEITEESLRIIAESNVDSIKVIQISAQYGPYIRNTMFADKNMDEASALIEIFKVLRPGELATVDAAREALKNVFFNADRYDLSEVGRVKINERLNLKVAESVTTITREDIFLAIKTLVAIKDSRDIIDDIDNLGNRRVRCVGELIENQFRIGLARVAKAALERISVIDIDSVMPYDLINSKLMISVTKDFFGTFQLSQFMDQTNPLSEISHKRRISALGPGGLSREHAGFEVRDVHATHYGRICPIETPEGQNIGLISSLATFAKINKHGFVEAPFRKVNNGYVTDEVHYLSATQEAKYKIAGSTVTISDNRIIDDMVISRFESEFIMAPVAEIDFIDLVPTQVFSVATSLIPLIENDDANRALMGANMQRQAVPLTKSQAPLVGTGIEKIVAQDSESILIALNDGIVEYVDSLKIVIRKHETEGLGVDIYNLSKFQKSNHNTCINQTPLVSVGDFVKKGDVISDGPSVDKGEIALGKNVLIAFVPWGGYNFEDAILISERIVRDDVYTSIHIEEFEIVLRDTRLGPEEITRDVPNVSEEAIRNLDEAGVIYTGAQIKPGDVLVGKITPKSETPVTSEEKLLRAIFGEKASDVKDSSLYAPPGVNGTVIEVRIFARRGIDKDQRAIAIERQQIDKLYKIKMQELSVIENFLRDKITSLLCNHESSSNNKFVHPGIKLDLNILKTLSLEKLSRVCVTDNSVMEKISDLKLHYEVYKKNLEKRFNDNVSKIQDGDDLPQGVLKIVKVFVATKHRLQIGDKMACRHGNKGVVSKIVPIEDMPFLEDGTIVDVILNPLSIPSRMNIGQVLETHLGWASLNLGKQIGAMVDQYKYSKIELQSIRGFVGKMYEGDDENFNYVNNLEDEDFITLCEGMRKGVYFSTPVFDGVKSVDIEKMLNLAGLKSTGQVRLIDGKTGTYFDRDVTVGVKYIMKLHHLVDDKMHARSIGPYSLVTQQPLGGKSYFGGQRFGEMEVWALQAYGAACILQEMLTIKSDDVVGRTKTYESIVLSKGNFKPNIPESFNVTVKELRALSLNLQFESKNENLLGPQIHDPNKFDSIKISIASPEQIRSWSSGEIDKPETINYRTFKPERGGLFCAKVFGPIKDYECLCGKYKRMKYKGVSCEKCGVEVTVSSVRRERMAHIDLAAPVVHIWFLKLLPSRIGLLLDMQVKNLEKILYFESYVVLDSSIAELKKGDLLLDDEINEYRIKYGPDRFEVGIGAEGIQTMLKSLDLLALKSQLHEDKANALAAAKSVRIAKRLKLVEEFITSGNRPEWMVMTALPVLPPDLRPLVMLEGGRFATSDLNELYRRVINRNNRLKRLLDLNAPEIIIRNEKRMLQESVDALLDNGRRGKVVKNNNKRPFKSLSDMLKGKQGRFRQNLLGKRVDYSGRSVIVVGPELKLHQCGLPKQMALELFKPFVYAKLQMYGAASTIKAVKKLVESQSPEVWDALEDVIKDHPVLLNRAPTLHRLSIQAFEPVLIEGKAIQLHPLVCSAFNADFDGDQMAVHVPLSMQAQIEARTLMMATNNILSPASGKPILVPDKDIVLGIYYLTLEFDNEPGHGMVFVDIDEIHHALDARVISLHTKIRFRMKHVNTYGDCVDVLVNTTPGRIILWKSVPKGDVEDVSFALVNKLLTKKDISVLVYTVYRHVQRLAAVAFIDNLMSLGFKYATISGMSFGISDMAVPESKKLHIDNTTKEVNEYETQYLSGLITAGEKYNKVVDAWSHCTDLVATDLMRKIALGDTTTLGISNQQKINSVYAIASSGARGAPAQIRQLAGMRGLMAKPNGEIIPYPIISNFLEGLKVTEYFISTNGARKGLTDTALKTANSGYLTRRLVDVAQDCIVLAHDCGTHSGIISGAIIESGEIVVQLVDQILGRTSALKIKNSITNELIVEAGGIIDEEVIKKLETAGINQVKVRSPLMCDLSYGMCAQCYGRDLSTNKLVSIGEAVGVIAAQSIGEPGTQLTMRTFHIGGAANRGIEISAIESSIDGLVKLVNRNVVQNSDGKKIVMSRACEILIIDNRGNEKARHKVPYGARLMLDDNDSVAKGQKIAEWDPYTVPIIAEKSGRILFQDIIDGVSMRDIADESTGIISKVIIEGRKYSGGVELKPRLHLLDEEGNISILANGLEARYYLPVNAILNIDDGINVHAGDILARIPRESTKTRDITGGLPRVTEIVEARKPKDQAVIADIDGRIEFAKDYKAKRRLILCSLEGDHQIEYIIQKGKHILVNDGDLVKKGEMLVDGRYVLQDILRIMGVEALANYMCQEIQNVYRLQGVKIDNKHIEIIVKQMLQKVQILDSGDSKFIVAERVDKQEVLEVNKKLLEQGLKSVKYEVLLQGITKASLQTNSFISAASFQETPRVLTEAAVAGKVDELRGLKENVIVGRMIPAGTGYYLSTLQKIATSRDESLKDRVF